MKKILRAIVLFIPLTGEAQCPTDLLTGQNLVTNGDFTEDYSGWTYTSDPSRTNGYLKFDPPTTQNFSSPGFIYAGSSPNFFNSAFGNFDDHTTTTSDNMMLMVDGICTSGIKLWSQNNIPISPNTNYYFSLWVHALKDNNNPPGTLQFDINGTNLATTITAPTALAAGWIQYETVWNSGSTPPATVTINIENTTTTGCDQYVDFAIDDIAFIPGCSYGSTGPQPDLGANQTLCGKGGSITLNSNVTHKSTTTVTWSTGASGTGLGAPYTLNVSTPGTYSVCVSDNGSCTKSDVIVVSNTYSIDLGADRILCSPASATLDAGFTGTGVTYQWYLESNGVGGWQQADTVVANGKNQTYFVNAPGTYRVEVTDPACGIRSDEITISTNAATPVNATYCTNGSTVNLSVTGSGTYQWYDTQTKGTGTLLGSGTTYTTPPLTAPNTYTFYVDDVSSTAGSVGATTYHSGGLTDWGTNPGGLQMKIHVYQDVTITSVKIPMNNINTSTGTITVEVRDASGNSFSPQKLFTSDPKSVTNALNNTLVEFTFTGFDIQAAWGNDLRLCIPSKTVNGAVLWNQGGGPYSYTYASSPASIIDISGSGGANATNNDYVYFYDIRFQTGVPCDRVPVQAIYSCPLPVSLTWFSAEKSGGSVLLQWTTAGEINSSHFIIERSEDGLSFYPIGQVNAEGNASSAVNYSFYDTNPLDGTGYYRLVEYDIDADYFYSKVETIEMIDTGVIVSPNPANNQFTVSFSMEEGESVSGQLYNSLGELIIHKYFNNSSDGKVSEVISIEGIASGVYYLKISGATQRATVKVIKE